MIPLYQILFDILPSGFIDDFMEGISPIGDWNIEKYFYQIRIYGCQSPPYAIPRYLSSMLDFRELVYQTIGTSITIYS